MKFSFLNSVLLVPVTVVLALAVLPAASGCLLSKDVQLEAAGKRQAMVDFCKMPLRLASNRLPCDVHLKPRQLTVCMPFKE
jgi:hypothetical protein